ncbi:hypothetical protein ElyMa_005812700 [Elysia marginata]|uniref:Uncharacterized protein n=1 Tax=Elysia marginata TaxID=1093978 RepID=A0AAV4FUZ4_9GAST|nr:hypothetical protein ElyMa_005812700 [Elysia marginata]
MTATSNFTRRSRELAALHPPHTGEEIRQGDKTLAVTRGSSDLLSRHLVVASRTPPHHLPQAFSVVVRVLYPNQQPVGARACGGKRGGGLWHVLMISMIKCEVVVKYYSLGSTQ